MVFFKSWESLDEDHVQELNLNLPKEKVNDKTMRARPPIEQTHQEIHRLQKNPIIRR